MANFKCFEFCCGSISSSVIISRGAVAIYTFTGARSVGDVSKNKNPPGRKVGVTLTRGPDNHPKGAYYFSGRRSYVLIPNNGCLDTRYSITIMAWVYPERPGPIFHFNPKGWGVHLWMTKVNELFVRFVPRSGRRVSPVVSRKIKPRRWNFIAATYDYGTGLATLWLEGLPIAQKNIGRFPNGLATNYPVVVGKKPGDRRAFRGKISCLQVFNVALTRGQIISKRIKCFRTGECHVVYLNNRRRLAKK